MKGSAKIAAIVYIGWNVSDLRKVYLIIEFFPAGRKACLSQGKTLFWLLNADGFNTNDSERNGTVTFPKQNSFGREITGGTGRFFLVYPKSLAFFQEIYNSWFKSSSLTELICSLNIYSLYIRTVCSWMCCFFQLKLLLTCRYPLDTFSFQKCLILLSTLRYSLAFLIRFFFPGGASLRLKWISKNSSLPPFSAYPYKPEPKVCTLVLF